METQTQTPNVPKQSHVNSVATDTVGVTLSDAEAEKIAARVIGTQERISALRAEGKAKYDEASKLASELQAEQQRLQAYVLRRMKALDEERNKYARLTSPMAAKLTAGGTSTGLRHGKGCANAPNYNAANWPQGSLQDRGIPCAKCSKVS